MTAKLTLSEAHLPAIRGVMQLHPTASIYKLSELVAIRLKMPKLGYVTLAKFLDRHGLVLPKSQRRAVHPRRITGPAEVLGKARSDREGPVTPPVCLTGETLCDVEAGSGAGISPKRRPPARLTPAHLPLVRRVVDANPGLSLAKLGPLVAKACGLPHMTDFTLHRFLAAYGIERQVPAHVMHRSERLRAKGVVMFPTSMTVVAPVKGAAEVSAGHRAIGTAHSSVFALGGLGTQRVRPPLPHSVPCGQKPSEALRRIWLDEARREATTWLSAQAMRRAARAALPAALSRSREEPDPEEFDPDNPRDWYTPRGFAEDVADLFRLAIFEMAYAYRPDDSFIEHECNQLGRLGGAVELLRALSEDVS